MVALTASVLMEHYATTKFFRKLRKGLTYVPRVIITDKRKSYGAAKREILPGVELNQQRYRNNRAENSQRPTRQRERRMQRFQSPGQAQCFLAAHGHIAQPRRSRCAPSVPNRETVARKLQAGPARRSGRR